MANLYLNLSGGMNRKTSPLIIKDEECELLVNFNLDKVGAITKRKGYSTFASQPVAGKTVNGLYQFNEQSSNAAEQLMVANNSGDTQGVIYYNNAGTWTAGKSDDTASKETYFTSFIDYVFRVNGADAMASSTDGQSWGTTNCLLGVLPKYAAVFQDRVYAANGSTGGGLSRVWFSSLPNAAADQVTWDVNNDYFDVNPDDGDQITGLENNGNRLLIFKSRALYRWTFGQVEPDRLIGIGASTQACIKTNLDVGVTFFANPNGVYAYTGGRPKLLSRKIQDIIDGVSDWTTIRAEIDDDHYYLSVGNVSIDGRTYANTVLVYHISLDAWSVYQLATKPTMMARLSTTAPIENVYFGSTDGRTYKFLDGTDDNDTEIASEFRSKEYLMNYPDTATLNRIDVFAQNRGTARTLVDMDRQDDPYDIGMLGERITVQRPSDIRRGNSVRVYIYDNSKNDCVIEGFNLDFEVESRRNENSKLRRKHGNN